MSGSGLSAVQRWSGGEYQPDQDVIAGETAVALSYNRQAHVVMMATAADLEDFALGFSLSEGIVRHAGEVLAVRVLEREQGLELAITVAEEARQRLDGQRRNLTGRTGCGLCGAETLQQAVRYPSPLGHTLQVSHAALQRALAALPGQQPLQAATGAVHCAAWCSPGGDIVAAREDVGRHNALDKLIGHLAASGQVGQQGFVLVSSRASYEMVSKTAAAGIELMMAVSAPTTLAIEFARHCGMTLVGFARIGRHNVYTHPERLLATPDGPDK
jgi:FdhD protein